jgi:hypothetical protein
MAATIDDITASVVTLLNAASFSLEFTAEASDQPVYKPQDLATLQVAVVPAGQKTKRVARSKWQQEYTVWVGVFHRPEPFDSSARAARKALVQEIIEFLEGTETITAGGVKVTLMGIENEVLQDPEHLEQHRQFTSVMALTFTAWR